MHVATATVYLIDGTAFCYRAHYAVRDLRTSDGRPTNAVYGFAVMLQALRDRHRPRYLGVAFDAGKPTFRHEKFAGYKVQRKPMPEGLIAQLPLVKRLLAAYRIPVFEQEGYEGEDLLATIAAQVTRAEADVLLVTGDKDALQLVGERIKVMNPHQDNGSVLDAQAVQARYGVSPQGLVDLMALMGDAVDNIPGVTGIGEKTARKLLEQFGSLDALYQRLGEVGSDALRRRLEAGRAQAELSRELARINAQAPLHTDLNALQLREPDWPALRSLFRELEFKRLLQAVQEEHPAAQSPEQMEAVRIVGSQEFVKAVQGARAAACAIGCWEIGSAASGLFADVEPGILLVAFDTEKRAWATIIGRDAREIGRTLVSWLEDPGAPKLAHNAKAAARLLGRAGILLGGVVGDTMVAGYLVNPVRSTQTLGDLMDEYLQESCPQPPPLACVASTDALAPFGRWVRCVARLHERLLAELDSRQAGALYRELEVPLIEVLARMESRGVALDTAHLQRLQGSMGVRLQQLGGQLHQMAGGEFNLNSPKQLAGVLFERLQLPVLKRTKTGPSTDSEVLRQLAEQHPLPRLLLEYRELSKLVSTYVEALPKLLDPATGRLHTTFNQTATATGRLSSSEPNLQNIPIKTELGRSIRKAFVAGLPDGLLVAGDYSQIELRILAHVSGDPHLLDAFRQGRDIHRFTASLIYGLPEAEVQPEQRNAMKAVNFGILYGMSARGLSRELGVSFEEAQAFIDAYFQRYARVRAYLDEQIAQAKRDGYVQTLLGRRRYLPELSSPDPVIRQFGERAAINAPIQGTAADLIKRAMIRVDAALREQRLESRMVLQVHDELVFEAPRRELPALAALAKGIMEGALALDVPLVVTMKAGPNWLELSPVP